MYRWRIIFECTAGGVADGECDGLRPGFLPHLSRGHSSACEVAGSLGAPYCSLNKPFSSGPSLTSSWIRNLRIDRPSLIPARTIQLQPSKPHSLPRNALSTIDAGPSQISKVSQPFEGKKRKARTSSVQMTFALSELLPKLIPSLKSTFQNLIPPPPSCGVRILYRGERSAVMVQT